MAARVVIVGGGVVGLATAFRLLARSPGVDVVVLEKEPEVARHQSGRNSGVLHSGVYYAPGSLKATCCRRGARLMREFCAAEGVPLEMRGKIILATREAELPRLERIAERGRANGVRAELIGPERIAELEPHARGLRALHVQDAGVVDYGLVCVRLSERIAAMGGRVETGARVRAIRPGRPARVETERGAFEAELLVNAAGLYSDRLAKLAGARPPVRIAPFRGEYHRLTPGARRLCRTMIYPVPDPALPFLGVHLTRTIDGEVECGPNAVLTWSREGYDKGAFRARDALSSLGYPPLWLAMLRGWRAGLGELRRSLSTRAMARDLARLTPEVRPEDLRPSRSGVRAQAIDARGRLVDDFVLHQTDNAIHVCNAPSPAATASLAIADLLVDRIEPRLASP